MQLTIPCHEIQITIGHFIYGRKGMCRLVGGHTIMGRICKNKLSIVLPCDRRTLQLISIMRLYSRRSHMVFFEFACDAPLLYFYFIFFNFFCQAAMKIWHLVEDYYNHHWPMMYLYENLYFDSRLVCMSQVRAIFERKSCVLESNFTNFGCGLEIELSRL